MSTGTLDAVLFVGFVEKPVAFAALYVPLLELDGFWFLGWRWRLRLRGLLLGVGWLGLLGGHLVKGWSLLLRRKVDSYLSLKAMN